MKKIDVYPEQGKCPLCGSVDLIYEATDIDDAGLTYHANCQGCGAKFAECYDLVFAGHWNIYDKEGSQYEDLPT